MNPDRRSEKPRPAPPGSYSLSPVGGGLATTFSPSDVRIIPDVPACYRKQKANLALSTPRWGRTTTQSGVCNFETRVQLCNTQKRTDELKSHLCWNSNSSVNGLKAFRIRDSQASLLAGDRRHNSCFRNALSQLPAICLFCLPAPDHKAPLLCLRPRLSSVNAGVLTDDYA
jgi:hypothetical protein